MIGYLLLILAIVGLLMYLMTSRADIKEIGKILFFCALFWFCYALVGKTVKLL